MNTVRLQSIAAALLLLAGCAGGSTNGSPVPSALTDKASQYSLAVRIPAGPVASVRRARHFVSPHTASIKVDVLYSGGRTSTIANTNAQSSACTAASNSLVCQIALIVQPGAQSFVVSTFDGANASGDLLATNSVAVPPPSGALTTVQVTLNGVPAALSLAFVGAVPRAGTSGTYTLAVNALDASGAVIGGPGSFSAPVTLQTDTPSHVTIAPATVTDPGTPVTVTYDGATVSSAIVRASAANGPYAAVNIFGASGGGTLPPGGGAGNGGGNGPHLYVADTATNAILMYSLPLAAGSTPSSTFQVTTPSQVIGVSIGANLGVAAIGTLSGQVLIYPVPLASSATPMAVLSLPSGVYGAYSAFDSSGNLWVADQMYDVYEFSPPFNTGNAPSNHLSMFSGTFGVAFDAQNTMYVTNADSSGIVDAVPAPYSASNYQYAIYPTAPNASLLGVTVEGSQVWVADGGGGNVSAYTIPVTTSSTPAITTHIAGGHPHAIVFDDSNNKVYVSDATTTAPHIYIFNQPVSSSSTPSAILSSGFSRPNGMAIGP